MKLRKQFSNLKKGAKKVFVGMLVLCLISTATGIGSIFAYATECENHYAESYTRYDENTHIGTCVNCGKEIEAEHSFNSEGECVVCGYNPEPTNGDDDGSDDGDNGGSGDGSNTGDGTSYGEWQKNDETTHIRYNNAGESETQDHQFTDWVSNGNGVMARVCTVCGYMEEQADTTGGDTHTHTHTYTYTDNGDGTHTAVCSECEDTKTEAHNLGRWTFDGRGNHTRTCSLCEYSEVEPCSFDENGICTVCGANQADMIIASSKKAMKFNARLLSLPTPTTEGLVEGGTGPIKFSQFFGELPTVNSGLVYNGKSQLMLTSFGTPKSQDEMAEFGVESGWTVSTTSDTEATNAGTYQMILRIPYVYKDAEGNVNNYEATGTYTVQIAKASFANDVEISPTSSSYVEMSIPTEPFVSVSINGVNLNKGGTYGYDYSISEGSSFASTPYVGDSRTFVFSATTGNPNFDNTTISKTILVEDVSPTFNGSTNIKENYHGDVTIEPPSGYSVAPHIAGSSDHDTFVDKYVVSSTPLPETNELFFKYNQTGKIILKQVAFSIVDSTVCALDDLVKTYPVFYDSLTYKKDVDQNLMSSAPILNDQFIADNHLTVSWGFTKVGTTTETTVPTGQDLGLHKYTFFVKYTPLGGSETTLKVTTPYQTTILKDIGHSDIVYTPQAIDYQSLNSSKNLLDFYDLKDNGQQLQRNVDYSVKTNVDTDAGYYEAGKDITLTFEGINNSAYYAYYEGTTTKTVKVSAVNVLLNGKAQEAKYADAVEFTADGYTISDKADGVFNTKFTYSNPCKDLTLPLYFKKDGTSRIVKQNIVGLNIGEAANITVLYDGSSEMKPLYIDSVILSAEGYKVTDKASYRYEDAEETYTRTYDSSASTQTPVPDFKLYFFDKTTKVKYEKIISGLNLSKTPDITILYNGDDLKEWYSDNVAITATGYKIADAANAPASKYVSKYSMTGNGVVTKKLYFNPDGNDPVAHPENVKSFNITVAIDKTAPTGVINLSSYSSDSFTTKDAVKAYTNGSQKATISASDALSGIDYIHYYVSDTFYASPSDVKAAISEKSGAWRTYSSSSQPTTVKDKNNYIYAKLVDKAGNETIISLGNILYDTVAPKMTTAKVTPSSSDSSKSLIGLAGTDKLSGINRFKYIFQEKEEGKEYSTPSKDHMFNNGEIVYTSSEQDGTAVASATIDVLDAAKTYLFYFIAVDRAGNISDVMTQEVKGSSASKSDSGSGSGASGKSSGGGSGLSPAANGIAGSGSGSGSKGGSGSGSGSSSSTKSSKSSSKNQSALGDKDREINRNPYIAEATGNVKIGINETSGWNKIASEVNKADKGAVIEVEMAGLSNVSNELFTSMNNRDVQVKLRMAEDVEWEIKGEEVPDARSDIDMGVRLGSRNIPEQIIADVAGTNPHVEFSINHNGDFGFVATIAVPVGESNKGMYTTLYHYDEAKKELEVAGDGRVDDRGYAKFPLTHASDYTVVITPERILTAAETDAQTNTLVGAEAESQSSQYLDGARLRLTDLFRIKGSMRIWLFFIALLSATICMVILYLPALQSRNQNDQGDLF